MFLRDHYFLKCDPSLQTFLKQKGKLSLKEVTKASNDYYEAHGYPKETRIRNQMETVTQGQTNQNVGLPTAPPSCENCGL